MAWPSVASNAVRRPASGFALAGLAGVNTPGAFACGPADGPAGGLDGGAITATGDISELAMHALRQTG